jgi:hypothetical protein
MTIIKPCAKHHSTEVCQDITVVQALTAVSLEKTNDTWLQPGRNASGQTAFTFLLEVTGGRASITGSRAMHGKPHRDVAGSPFNNPAKERSERLTKTPHPWPKVRIDEDNRPRAA